MGRKVAATVALLAALWLAFGAWTLSRRAARPGPTAGVLRGAWHVHTARSDGLAPLRDVVRAAREAGLQFVVVADHNALAPSDAGYHDGVLVVEATEISSAYGHVVAIGLPGPPGAAEKADPLGRIAAEGGVAAIAHPLHPLRPFTGWGTGPWRGFEVVSNDSAWYQVLHDRAAGRLLLAALALPFDSAQTVLWLSRPPVRELARFDAEVTAARREGRALPALLCSADAHGYPSYRAAFEAFSMHVPGAFTGDAAVDTRTVLAGLLEGRAACVFDGVAAAGAVRLERPGPGALELSLEGALPRGATGRLLRDGDAVTEAPLPRVAPVRLRLCGGGCPPGSYRVEVTVDGRPWIFTNPVAIE